MISAHLMDKTMTDHMIPVRHRSVWEKRAASQEVQDDGRVYVVFRVVVAFWCGIVSDYLRCV